MSVLGSVYLQFVAGSSAKFYRLRLSVEGPVFVARVEWGRIGTAGQSAEQYRGPDRAAAEKILTATEKSKRAKGYISAPDPAGTPAATQPVPRTSSAGVGAGLGSELRFPAQLAGENGNLAVALAAPDKYVMEEKFDGFRALLALLPGGRIEIRNRYGEVKGRQGPHIVAALTALAQRHPALYQGTIFDGEIAAATWNQTMKLLASGGAGNIFHVFDLPVLAGVDLRPLPLRARLAKLDPLLAQLPSGGAVQPTPRSLPRAGLVEAIWQAGGEGIIIKRLDAPYIPGDRSAWTKIKQTQTDEAVITGFERGHGKYAATVGAVILSQYRHGALVEVCRVSGMRDEVRRALDASWIGTVVEFAFQIRTAGSYRHPRWLRPRPDKKAADCHWKG